MMWIVLFAVLIILSIAASFYLVSRIHRFSFIKRLEKKNKILSWIISVIPLIITGGLFSIINIWSVIIVFIHLFVFWIGCDIVASFIRKLKKSKPDPDKIRKNYEGLAAILITAVYLGMGWYLAHHVFVTQYQLKTNKSLGQDNLRIVEIADSHLGITLDGEKFAQQIEHINQTNPDILVIAGDFVDDDSEKEDMIRACEALGNAKTNYGVYFIFGNHDKGYYEGYRNFKTDELVTELEKNNVIILEDESILVNDSFYVIGRQDKSEEQRSGGRSSMQDIISDLDSSKYMITLDHQPNAYDEEAQSGVDLVLSGHTHGGHIFPAGQIGLWIKANDRVYGTEKRNNTDFIVTSGISGWAIPFKTGTFSEFVIIDITN
ncbi:MAG TPA: metallophosphoesterase [Ruminococcus sp.]|nr:metallophosphoesterase [Ruminococcus sp.]